MFRLASAWLSPAGSIAATVLYVASPYQLVLVYYRSDFAELLAALQPLECLSPLRDVEHRIDERHEMSRVELARDGVELRVVPHRRSHNVPLIPEQSPDVHLDHRPRCRAAGDQPAAPSESAE